MSQELENSHDEDNTDIAGSDEDNSINDIEGEIEEEQEAPAKVEFTKEQQRRFNEIYRELKETKETARSEIEELSKVSLQLMERLKAYELGQAEAASNTKIDGLKEQLRVARSNGDDELADELRIQIAELRAEDKILKRIAEAQKKAPVAKPEARQEQPSPFTEEEHRIIQGYAEATNDDGEYLYPWMHDGHPKRAQAQRLYYNITVSPDTSHYTPQQKFKRVADVISGKNRAPSGGNMTKDGRGDLTPATKQGKIAITTNELEIAKRLGVSTDTYRKMKANVTRSASGKHHTFKFED